MRWRGITLIELLFVVTIIALIAAIAFPSVTAGLDSIRLLSATDSVAAFLNAGLNRAERRQQLVEIVFSKSDSALFMRSSDPSFFRRLSLPEGVRIAKFHPEIPGVEENARTYVLYPGGAIPRFGLELENRRGVHRIVRVDPITGVPVVEQVVQP